MLVIEVNVILCDLAVYIVRYLSISNCFLSTDTSLFIIYVRVYKVSSSPVTVPELKYGSCAGATWSWLDVSSPIFKCPEKVLFSSFTERI